jgi:hypothetical protein
LLGIRRATESFEERLLQRGIERRELGVEGRTQAIHHGDDRERDARRDQTIFDRGRPRFIRQKSQKVMLQLRLRCVCAELAQLRKITDSNLRLHKKEMRKSSGYCDANIRQILTIEARNRSRLLHEADSG